jgi:hypothetical protein
MSDLLTTAEAAAIWGCTERNIRHYAAQGKLPIAQVVRSRGGNEGMCFLFRATDVLNARATRNATRKITARRNGIAGRERQRAHRDKLIRIWWTLPKAERKGRDWMRKAHQLYEAQKAQGQAYEL